MSGNLSLVFPVFEVSGSTTAIVTVNRTYYVHHARLQDTGRWRLLHRLASSCISLVLASFFPPETPSPATRP